jgi:two-component system sensor histidine kinase RegB
MTLLQLLREVVEPFAASEDVRVEAVVTGPPSVAAPDLWRRPEILHAVAAIVENAYDFAKAEILVTARFDAEIIGIEVRDDGPGFAPHVLAKLGEPYVTSRPGAEGSRTGHIGMGLGFFIAKTLLERVPGGGDRHRPMAARAHGSEREYVLKVLHDSGNRRHGVAVASRLSTVSHSRGCLTWMPTSSR